MTEIRNSTRMPIMGSDPTNFKENMSQAKSFGH